MNWINGEEIRPPAHKWILVQFPHIGKFMILKYEPNWRYEDDEWFVDIIDGKHLLPADFKWKLIPECLGFDETKLEK